MLSELLRRAGEPYPAGVPGALDSLREFGDFPGRGYVPSDTDRRRQGNNRHRRAPTPEMLMESFFGAAMGNGDDVPLGSGPGGGRDRTRGSNPRSGSYVMTPNGLTRIDFPLQNARYGGAAREELDQRQQQRVQERHRRQHHARNAQPNAPPRAQRGVPQYPQPQRYPQPDEVHQHHIFQRGDRDSDSFGDVPEMLNEVFSDMFTAFNRNGVPGARGGAAGFPGGMGGILTDYLQSILPRVAGGEQRQYEDWLQFVDRMGSVNRGATDAEINRLPSERFDQQMLERVRMKRRQREGGPSGSRRSSGGGSAAGASKSTAADEVEKCAICLGEYEEGEEVKTLPCFHVFHTECVDRWLKVNKICPFCKQSIRPGDGPGA